MHQPFFFFAALCDIKFQFPNQELNLCLLGMEAQKLQSWIARRSLHSNF